MAALSQPATRCCGLSRRSVDLLPKHAAVPSRVSRQAATRRGVPVLRASPRQPARKPALQPVPERFADPDSYKLWPTELAVSKNLYNAVIAGEMLFFAALADAAFSGDWSRVGVLTTDQELLAQEACKFILVAHTFVAGMCVWVALPSGYSPLAAGVKGLLFGTLGLYDVYLRCEAEAERQ